MAKYLDFENQDKIEIHVEQQQKKEIKLIGKQRKIAGLTLWEFNENTKELRKAEFKKVDYELKSLSETPDQMQINHKVIVNEGCVYIQALNKKVAIRKLSNKGLL